MKGDFQKVYKIVEKIPEGKVMTYGQIGQIVKLSPKIVGFALHANNNPEVPCHRVVNIEGRVAPGFAFGGPSIQRKKLEIEGVTFKDESHVDMEKHLLDLK